MLTNLVDNALKFTPPGGSVTISAGSAGQQVEIIVTDSGPGIPPASLPHLFERFYQVDSSRQGGQQHGAGLGLAIAHEIMRAHHGTITVLSSPGQGTQFSLKLPVNPRP